MNKYDTNTHFAAFQKLIKEAARHDLQGTAMDIPISWHPQMKKQAIRGQTTSHNHINAVAPCRAAGRKSCRWLSPYLSLQSSIALWHAVLKLSNQWSTPALVFLCGLVWHVAKYASHRHA
eukprot:633467-Pelagomonas_calceolata.AAC.4